jgi:peptide-methionine (S)-S-oxide reductase
MPGVIRTTVGYSGGNTVNPDYTNIGDHSEVILIEYDPLTVTYADLLAVFWDLHDPTSVPWSRQYRNAIFPLTESQQQQAEQSYALETQRSSANITTAIEPAGAFYPAEDYHQKFLLRQSHWIFSELRALFDEASDFAASTAAARVNGYLGCNGDPVMLQQQIEDFGLSRAVQEHLIKVVADSCEQFYGLTCPAPR